MKLCRFILIDSPDTVRAGIYYGGKLYETDGKNPIAVHDWEGVRLMSPVSRPPSFRAFAPQGVSDELEGLGVPITDFPSYTFRNPTVLTSPGWMYDPGGPERSLGVVPYIGVVLATDGKTVPLERADECVLGLTLMIEYVALEVETIEREVGAYPGASRDLCCVVGPMLTTPDEILDRSASSDEGLRVDLPVTVWVNDAEMHTCNLAQFPYTIAEYVRSASMNSQIMTGELLGIPLTARPLRTFSGEPIGYGDRVRVASDLLGTLNTSVGER